MKAIILMAMLCGVASAADKPTPFKSTTKDPILFVESSAFAWKPMPTNSLRFYYHNREIANIELDTVTGAVKINGRNPTDAELAAVIREFAMHNTWKGEK